MPLLTFVQSETQIASPRFWAQVTNSISYDYNPNTKCTFVEQRFNKLISQTI